MQKLNREAATARVYEEVLGWERVTYDLDDPRHGDTPTWCRVTWRVWRDRLLCVACGQGDDVFWLYQDPYTWEFFGLCIEAMRGQPSCVRMSFSAELATASMEWFMEYDDQDVPDMSTLTPELGFHAVCWAIGIDVVE